MILGSGIFTKDPTMHALETAEEAKAIIPRFGCAAWSTSFDPQRSLANRDDDLLQDIMNDIATQKAYKA
jgi:hypothetical protein